MKITGCLLFCLLAFQFCGPQQTEVEKITEGGIEVVFNQLEPYEVRDTAASLTLEKELVIDTEDDGIVATGLVDMETFDVDGAGNIYIIRWTSNEDFVYKFDSEGRFLLSFVRRGQGPGEIEWGGMVKWTGENEVIVKDPGKTRFCVFDTEGRFVRDVQTGKHFSILRLLEDGRYLAYRLVQDPKALEFENLVGFCSPDFAAFDVFYSFGSPNSMRAERIEVSGNRRVWASTPDSLYVGRLDLGYEIWGYDWSGNVVRKIRKEYVPVPISEEFKRAYMERIPENSPFREKMVFPDEWPPMQHMFTDETGRLFVMTYEPGETPGEFIYDVFTPEGVFIARTALANRSGRMPLKAMAAHGRIYLIREKESGFKELVVFKASWQ